MTDPERVPKEAEPQGVGLSRSEARGHEGPGNHFACFFPCGWALRRVLGRPGWFQNTSWSITCRAASRVLRIPGEGAEEVCTLESFQRVPAHLGPEGQLLQGRLPEQTKQSLLS